MQQISPLNVPVSDPHNDRPGWEVETALDVEVVHAFAPGAHIIVLTSPVAQIEGTTGLPEFRQLYQYAIAHYPGSVISNSWIAYESTLQDAAGKAEMQQWDTMLKQAVTQAKITVLGGSGDAFHYSTFPNDDPWVISVGGSSVEHIGSNITETPWYEAGGGQSSFFSEPSYQKQLPASAQDLLQGKRSMPDVSADAEAGLPMYDDGNWGFAGGTSEASPIWAALIAITNQMAGHPLGFLQPALYKVGSSSLYQRDFHDILANKGGYSGTMPAGEDAQPGWDFITGLGTPIAVNLLPDLVLAAQ